MCEWLIIRVEFGVAAEKIYSAGVLMHVIVAGEAEKFPVAAVGGVVVVVVVFVVDSEIAQVFSEEFAAAPSADVGEQRERLFPVALTAFGLFLAQLREELGLPFRIDFYFSQSPAV